MPTALFLSPHLDDVAFSCGATVSWLASQGWRCVLATAFTRSVRDPTGFALACQTDKGFTADVDYMALRRHEDAACGLALGAEVRWMDFTEAPHRGYDTVAKLFAPPHVEDTVVVPLGKKLCTLYNELNPDITFAPLALGAHVDHVQLKRAVELALVEHAALAWYSDMPYAMRDANISFPLASNAYVAVALDVQHLQTKLDGCACYSSQLIFQFGDIHAMRLKLAAFAYDEGLRASLEGKPAERFLAMSVSAPWLMNSSRG